MDFKARFIFLIIAVLIGNYFFYKPSIAITSNLNQYQFHTYDDSDKGGLSSSSVVIDSGKVIFKYIKRKKSKAPYAALVIENNDFSLFKLEGYKAIIKGSISGASYVAFRLVQNPTGNIDEDANKSVVYNDKLLYRHEGVLDQEIDLNELQPPWWWMKNNSDVSKNVPKTSFDHTLRITLDHDVGIPFGQEATITISELRFEHPMYVLKGFNALGLFILLSLGLVFYYRKSKIKEVSEPITELVSVPFLHQQEDQTSSEVDFLKVEKYLSTNYMDHVINLPKTAFDLGISERKVSEIIKKQYSHSFRQHLNYLRISEAKLLLEKTDLQIQEISHRVGYDNQVHFLRVFKKSLEITPSEFRDLSKKSIYSY